MMLAGDELIYEPGFEVEAVDTTGAGDVFRAAFIYALLNGTPPREMLRFANAAAAVSLHARRRDGRACRRAGSRPTRSAGRRQRFRQHAAHRVGQRDAGQERQRRREIDRRGRLEVLALLDPVAKQQHRHARVVAMAGAVRGRARRGDPVGARRAS